MSIPSFLLDANTVNARQLDSALNQLERYAEQGLCGLDFAQVSYDEACTGSAFRAEKADKSIWIGLTGVEDCEVGWREKIAEAVFPAGVSTQSQRNDIEILLTAKLSGKPLVTRDGASKTQPKGLLGSKIDLAQLGITVLSPEEAVEIVRTQPD